MPADEEEENDEVRAWWPSCSEEASEASSRESRGGGKTEAPPDWTIGGGANSGRGMLGAWCHAKAILWETCVSVVNAVHRLAR